MRANRCEKELFGRWRSDQKISGSGYRTIPTRFGGLGEVVHLAGGNIVEAKSIISSGTFGQRLMKLHHGVTEQNSLILLRGAVGMKLDENPVRTRPDMHIGLDPLIQSRHGRGLTSLDTAIFNARHQSPG